MVYSSAFVFYSVTRWMNTFYALSYDIYMILQLLQMNRVWTFSYCTLEIASVASS